MIRGLTFLFFCLCGVLAGNAQALGEGPIGGTPVDNLGVVIPNKVYRGAAPLQAGVLYLRKNMGVRTIIDLRQDRFFDGGSSIDAERNWAREAGVENFIHIPIQVSHAPSDESVNEILELMDNSRMQPVFLHCRYGMDRTGLLVGLFRVLKQRLSDVRNDPRCRDLMQQGEKAAYDEMLTFGYHARQFFFFGWYFERRVKEAIEGECH